MEKPLNTERNQTNDVTTANQIMNNPRNDARTRDIVAEDRDFPALADDQEVPVPPHT